MTRHAEHGTATMYQYGCRCDECKAAKKEKRKERSGKRGRKPASFCIPIALCMSRDFGITYKDIGTAFGYSGDTVGRHLRESGVRLPKSGRNPGNLRANARSHREFCEKFFDNWEKGGYGDKFELIGDVASSKGKVRLKCKLCGEEFDRFGNITTQHANVRCPNCWIHRDDETIAPRDYRLAERLAIEYEQGSTISELSKKYGIQERPVSNLVKSRGVAIDSNRSCTIASKKRKEASEARRAEKQRVQRIRSEFRAVESDVRNMRRFIEVIEAEITKIERKIRIDARKLDEFEIHEVRVIECSECGTYFLFWPSWEKYGRRVPPMYCSKRCSRRHYKRIDGSDSIGHRLRKFGSGDAPRDRITLDSLIERDGGVCYLCGCKVDKSDSWVDENGYFVCGSTYPTRDHVIPIAKGGTHTWDNVKLACHQCNSRKSDRLLFEPKGASKP